MVSGLTLGDGEPISSAERRENEVRLLSGLTIFLGSFLPLAWVGRSHTRPPATMVALAVAFAAAAVVVALETAFERADLGSDDARAGFLAAVPSFGGAVAVPWESRLHLVARLAVASAVTAATAWLFVACVLVVCVYGLLAAADRTVGALTMRRETSGVG
jgi:hypothetical protein